MKNENVTLHEEGKITCWIAVTKTEEKDKTVTIRKNHNHIAKGWNEGDYPLPIDEAFSNQKAWKSMNWEKKFAYLHEGKVIYKEDMSEYNI